MNELYRSKGLSSAISYRDPKPAFRCLEAAFGFKPLFVILVTSLRQLFPFRSELPRHPFEKGTHAWRQLARA